MRFEGRLLHDQRYLWGLIGRPFQFLQSSLSVNANSHQSNPDDASDLGCRSPPRGRWWAPPLAARCVSEKRGSDVDIGVAGGLGEGCLEEGSRRHWQDRRCSTLSGQGCREGSQRVELNCPGQKKGLVRKMEAGKRRPGMALMQAKNGRRKENPDCF
jgi:hypothetical protein